MKKLFRAFLIPLVFVGSQFFTMNADACRVPDPSDPLCSSPSCCGHCCSVTCGINRACGSGTPPGITLTANECPVGTDDSVAPIISTLAQCTANPQCAGYILGPSNKYCRCLAPGTIWNAMTFACETNAILSWNPRTYSFGSVEVGTPGTPFTLSLKNTGTSDATGCGIPSLSDTNNFSITGHTCTNPLLAPGQACTATVTTKPVSTGLITAFLSRACAEGTPQARVQVTGLPPTPGPVATALDPSYLGCIPLSIKDYDRYDSVWNNCGIAKADVCQDGVPLDLALDLNGTVTQDSSGFYTPSGVKCNGVTAASRDCPFEIRFSATPICEQKCGLAGNPLKCKKVDRFEVNYKIEMKVEIPGIPHFNRIQTGSGGIPPARIIEVKELLNQGHP